MACFVSEQKRMPVAWQTFLKNGSSDPAKKNGFHINFSKDLVNEGDGNSEESIRTILNAV